MARSRPFGAAYTADRAAALAGVPVSTLHYWARTRIWAPSVSSEKVRRWSYSDLFALRLVDWLRSDKPGAEDDPGIPRTSMPKIRRALEAVEDIGEGLRNRAVRVWVEPSGNLVLEVEGRMEVPLGRGFGQRLAGTEALNLVDVYESVRGLWGPHLSRPAPTLAIIPGKLSGEPHVAETRIPTLLLAALAGRGTSPERILELYPRLNGQNLAEAVELEARLSRKLKTAA